MMYVGLQLKCIFINYIKINGFVDDFYVAFLNSMRLNLPLLSVVKAKPEPVSR